MKLSQKIYERLTMGYKDFFNSVLNQADTLQQKIIDHKTYFDMITRFKFENIPEVKEIGVFIEKKLFCNMIMKNKNNYPIYCVIE